MCQKNFILLFFSFNFFFFLFSNGKFLAKTKLLSLRCKKISIISKDKMVFIYKQYIFTTSCRHHGYIPNAEIICNEYKKLFLIKSVELIENFKVIVAWNLLLKAYLFKFVIILFEMKFSCKKDSYDQTI